MKKKILSLAVILVMLLLCASCGSKTTLEVVNSQGQSTVYEANGATILEVLDAAGVEYEGIDESYGYMLTKVNGEVADFYENGAYWAVFVNNNESSNISTQEIKSGDSIKIVFTNY